VDDDEDSRFLYTKWLEKNYEVVEAKNGHEGLRILTGDKDIAIAIVDNSMNGMSGCEMLKRAEDEKIYVPAIICSSYYREDIKEMIKCERLTTVKKVLQKPVEKEDLKSALENAIKETYKNI
jgi:CheY-like chemotaxis protein